MSVRDTVTIPPGHEAIVYGKLKNPHSGSGIGTVESVKEGKVVKLVGCQKCCRQIIITLKRINKSLQSKIVNKGAYIAKVTPVVSCEK